MYDDEHDESDQSFEETLRSIAHELGESVQRRMAEIDVDEIAEAIGVDAERAREWVVSASVWISRGFESLGDDVKIPDVWRRPSQKPEDPLRGAAPHPLDLPSEEQGLALSALESGRWTVEPGTDALSAHGEGPGPSDALGLVRELRARDWIGADGKLTSVGRHALGRWLDGAARA
jgi:hypothetical protein